MYISRGFQRTNEGAGDEPFPPPHSVDYHLVHDRLTMLERLAALRGSGTLSEEEFAVEKERILALPAEELVLRPAMPSEQRRPSLLGRLFNWKILALAVLLGLGLASFTQSDETMRLVQRLAG